MIVDTELEGHHVLWLCLTARVLLECQFSIVMVVNNNIDEVVIRIGQIDASLLSHVEIVGSPISEKTSVKEYFREVFFVYQKHGADEILFNNFDTIASKLFRRTVFGYKPPGKLFGKVAAIYHRPRPFDDCQKGFGVRWKRWGLEKLVNDGFFSHIFLLDPFIVKEIGAKFSEKMDIIHLPDPWLVNSDLAQPLPELKLNNNYKLLQYGVGDKRKGTDLLLNALAKIEEPLNITLVIAGKQKDSRIYEKIRKSRHNIILIDRFITNAEEKFLFECADMVTIPYLSHYGSSNILSKAAQYKKPVLASDYHLIGRLVEEHGLGLVFKNNDIDDLANKLYKISDFKFLNYQNNLKNYSKKCSFKYFSSILSTLFDN